MGRRRGREKKQHLVEVSIRPSSSNHAVVSIGGPREDEETSIGVVDPFEERDIVSWVAGVETTYGRIHYPLIVGVAMERNLDREDSKLAVIALCVGSRCMILPLARNRHPKRFRDFLLNPNAIFLGVNIEKKAKKLKKEWSLEIQKPKNILPLVKAFVGEQEPIHSNQIQDLGGVVLGNKYEVLKPEDVKYSNYEALFLNPEQVKFSAYEAWLSFEIGKKLLM